MFTWRHDGWCHLCIFTFLYFPNVTLVAGSVMGGGEGEPAALGSSEYCTFIDSIVYILCSLPGELDSPLCTGVVCFFLVEGDPAPSAMDAILWFLALNQQMTTMSTRKMRRKKMTTPPTDIPMTAVIPSPRPRGGRKWKRR